MSYVILLSSENNCHGDCDGDSGYENDQWFNGDCDDMW